MSGSLGQFNLRVEASLILQNLLKIFIKTYRRNIINFLVGGIAYRHLLIILFRHMANILLIKIYIIILRGIAIC